MVLALTGCVAAVASCSSSGGTRTSGSSTSTSSSSGGTSSSSGLQSSSSTKTAERYEPRASLNAARQETAVVALGGHLYIVGGFDDASQVVANVERYAPLAEQWESLTPLPMPLHHCNAAALDGRVYVLGALSGAGFSAVGTTLAYDVASNAWTTLTSMPAGTERGSSVVGVSGRRIYVVGGYRSGSVAQASFYDVDANTWTALDPLPEARDHMAGGVVGTRLVVAGGRNGALTARTDVLDLNTHAWTRTADMPTARAGTMGAVLGDRLYVFGGEGNRANALGVFDDAESLDLIAGVWTRHARMLPGRHGTAAATLDNVIHIPGGATREGFGAVATHQVFVP
jgi:N-acetylneuraminic acid mutarotase